jgi:hypothetical protein
MTRPFFPSLTRVALAVALVGCAWAAMGSVPAAARVTRQLLSHFYGAETPNKGIGIAVTEAVDNSSGPSKGDLYVGEFNFESGSAITKFTPAGVYAGVQITGAETPQGALGLLSFETFATSSIAVDDSTSANKGDLYVADIEHGVVDKFDETGKYICQISGAATPSTSECNGATGSDTPAGSMEPRGVAVNASGDIYVADGLHGVIDKFGPSGEYLEQIADAHITIPNSLAVGAGGALYVENGGGIFSEEGGGVLEYSATGGYITEFAFTNPVSMTADAASGHVYVSKGEEIAEFDANGEPFSSFQLEFGGPSLAVSDASGDLYVGQDGDVAIFGPAVVLPETTTDAATAVEEATATLNAEVEPDLVQGGGDITACQFEYVTAKQFGEHPTNHFEGAATAACVPGSPIGGASKVAATITVVPGTTYHFRISASDADGTSLGAEMTFNTYGPPSVENGIATAYAQSATVQAKIDPYGFATACEVQYVDEAKFKETGYTQAPTAPCSPAELEAGFATASVSARLTGLSVNTLYHYRFVGTNGSSAKVTDGPEATFTTFGIKSFNIEDLGPGGAVKYSEGYQRYVGPTYTQAGGHPFAVNIDFKLNTSTVGKREEEADANPKSIITELPPGLVGNATVLPRCTPGQLEAEECSGATQVGVLTVLQEGYVAGLGEVGIYNMVPPAGTPVALGANIAKDTLVFITANVRTGGDYGVTAVVHNASTNVGITGAAVELWGVPADPGHDARRQCPSSGSLESGPCSAGIEPKPFLSNPTSCAAASVAKLRIDSWQAPGQFVEDAATMPAMTGCNKLTFAPTLSVLPDTNEADSPSGMLVKLHVPQNESVEGLTSASLRDASITLPEGVTLNPSAANGLAACSEAQFGLHNEAAVQCPNASKVGSIEIETPLLFDKMIGSAYLAEENNNPFKSTFALYVAAQGDGAIVKVAGKVEANPVTGRLTGTFEETPEVPFSDFRLHFFGGPRAPLATPKVCGRYAATASLTPWSAPESGLPALPSSPFEVLSGPSGAPCATPGFAPSFTAGTTNVQAGAYTPFTLTMGRNDGEQNLGTIKTALPEGLTGVLSGVPLCGEPQASEGDCPAASQIGHVVTGVGAGPYPLFVPGPSRAEDPVYLTGSYKGAPFGLSVVVPAEAGPFNLDENGLPVVVRAKVSIDPVTAQVTVESDPLPQILKGVPLDIRDVNVVIDRPKFLVNPTDCDPTRVGATLTSADGIAAEPSVPFQVTDCAALKFTPAFLASTSAKTTKRFGASLHVALRFPKGSVGEQANVHYVKVELPKQLPARQVTLNHACVVKVFEEDPAKCPAASKVGYAKAVTPILPVPLNGPAYFVSYGGTKFPELVVVLRGYGITIFLHGETFINEKTSVISSTFKTVPDQPVESFELTLPEGEYSALAANGSFCAQPMVIPTTFVGQNGAEVKQRTPIEVSGCKQTLEVLRHRVSRNAVSVTVKAPTAGTLIATGKGVRRVAKKVRKAGAVTVVLHLTRRDRRKLARHAGRRLKVAVTLRFVGRHGKAVVGHLTVLMR